MINRDVEEKMPVANASPMYILVHPTQLFSLMEVKQQSLFSAFFNGHRNQSRIPKRFYTRSSLQNLLLFKVPLPTT